MINNLELIKPLLKFESEDDFYYLQILKRKKDQTPEENALGRNNNARTIKNYYINSVEYLENKMPEIIKLCEVFNARASLRLNKRSYKNVGFRTLQKITGTMANGDYSHLRNTYSKACGTGHNAGKDKTWIVDIDAEDVIWLEQIVNAIAPCEPKGNKILLKLPTKSGIHLITKPFNLMEFKENFKNELVEYQIGERNIDIHKDNPVNLYIP